ncbi:MAG: hypothetical protein PUC28_01580, partial [Blautia sp.]|nr:hypothetical protein [Blautia sp.]MDY2897821.1 hypothetical protein [Candidatus Limivivens sp.]
MLSLYEKPCDLSTLFCGEGKKPSSDHRKMAYIQKISDFKAVARLDHPGIPLFTTFFLGKTLYLWEEFRFFPFFVFLIESLTFFVLVCSLVVFAVVFKNYQNFHQISRFSESAPQASVL